jgi:integrase
VGRLRRATIQRFVDELVADGLAPQTVRNQVTALRVLLKWCVRQELVAFNPCDGLELPAGGETRDRIAPVPEAVELLGALSRADDRALYATAFFAGLRRGELMALRWSDVDLAARTINVRRSFDPKTRTFGAPKSKKGTREVGVPKLLVPYLDAMPASAGLVFKAAQGGPFSDRTVATRAGAEWAAAGLEPIGLHEARHTYASLMIAAGVNIKTISEWMGHSSITITLDRYGHLLPGSGAEALDLLDAYLERSNN